MNRILENTRIYVLICVLFTLAVVLNSYVVGKIPAFGTGLFICEPPADYDDVPENSATFAIGPTFPPNPWEEVAIGPTFPPNPWEEVAIGPTFPPNPWEEVAIGPTFPPNPWEEIAIGPTFPPNPWEEIAIGPTFPPNPWEEISPSVS